MVTHWLPGDTVGGWGTVLSGQPSMKVSYGGNWMRCKKYRYITWHRNWPCPGSSVSHMVLSWLSRSTASSRSTCSGGCLVPGGRIRKTSSSNVISFCLYRPTCISYTLPNIAGPCTEVAERKLCIGPSIERLWFGPILVPTLVFSIQT